MTRDKTLYSLQSGAAEGDKAQGWEGIFFSRETGSISEGIVLWPLWWIGRCIRVGTAEADR